jgi:tetratricopeptide (TPR) repeat protein
MFISPLARVVLVAAIMVTTPIIGLAATQALSTNAILLRQQAESESVRRQIDDLNTRISDTNGSIASINYGLVAFGIMVTVFGVMVTLLGLAAGILAIRSAEEKAREAARTSAKEWMDNHAQVLRRETSDQMHQMRLEFDDLKARIKALAEDAQKSMTAERLRTERKGEEVREALERVQASINARVSATLSQNELQTLRDTEHALKDKPENKYSPTDWLNRGLAAYAENEFEAAVEHFSEAVRTEGATQSEIATALVNKGFALNKLNRSNDAIATYNEVVERFKSATEPFLCEGVVKALINKGWTLNNMDRANEAMVVYNEAVGRFRDSTEPAVLEGVANALFNKGLILGVLDRTDEAIGVYDEIIGRFKDTTDREPRLRELVAKAYLNKGEALRYPGRDDEAIATFNEVISRLKDATEPQLRETFAMALVNKGRALRDLDRSDDAIATFNEVIARFNDATEPELREQVKKAKDGLAG